ncbi:MAG: anti-sigma factor family protein [Akkermansiaceae bacterium]
MNTPPDETTITLWMDGQLHGDELAAMDAWAAQHPELLAERDALHGMQANLRESIPASMEPAYPDFFNHKITRAIEDLQAEAAGKTSGDKPRAASPAKRNIWQWIAAPLALTAMAVCFYLGTKVGTAPSPTGPQPIVDASSVYTPDQAVTADIFNTDDQQATVIVLEGLDDIPDDVEMAGAPWHDTSKGAMISSQAID